MAKKQTYHHGDLRAALLQEAAQMLAEGGMESVTMRELGHRVGVSRSAPYRHFANKQALLVAVAAEGFERLRAELHAINVPEEGDELARFQQMGIVYIRFAIEHPAHYRLMYGKEALKRDQYPELDAAANATFYELVDIIKMYQVSGHIKPENAEALTYIAWSTVHGLASLLIDGQMLFPDDLEALAHLTTATLLDGMRA